MANPPGDILPAAFCFFTDRGRSASSLAKIFLAGSGSCDAGRPRLLPNIRCRVFADRERHRRISVLVAGRPNFPVNPLFFARE
jgi:hypothetical protein